MDRKIFMKRAIEIAEKNVSDLLGGPFGAVIVREGNIIGEGSNTVTSTNDPTAHAEINAIRQACQNTSSFNLSNSTIYTNCEPCSMCLSAIYWARIEQIFFANTKTDAAEIGVDDDIIYKEIILPAEKRSIPAQQIFIDEATIAFRAWEKSLSKTNY